MILRALMISVVLLGCSRGEYSGLRQLFTDASQLFRDYGRDLNSAGTPAQATLIMRDYNERIEKFIVRKDEILKRHPQLQDPRQLRKVCEQMDEFHTFRIDFTDFYRGGDRIARKFGKDKDFLVESKRGRKLILRML